MSSSIVNFGNQGLKRDREYISKITSWIKEKLNIIEIRQNNINSLKEFSILVTEVICNEPDCVPIETLVVLVSPQESESKHIEKILKPLRDVTEKDIASLLILHDVELNLKLQGYSNVPDFEILRTSIISSEKFIRNQISCLEDNQENISKYIEYMQALLSSIQMKHNLSNEVAIEQLQSVDKTVVTMIPQVIKNYEMMTEKERKPQAVHNLPIPVRHNKGSRPRGCPCCDPDNVENIVDKLLLNCPP